MVMNIMLNVPLMFGAHTKYTSSVKFQRAFWPMAQSMGQGGHLHRLPPPWLLVQGDIENFYHLMKYNLTQYQTLIFRDWWLTTVISVMFEFLEYSLEHQLPNFSECWSVCWLSVVVCYHRGEFLLLIRQFWIIRNVSDRQFFKILWLSMPDSFRMPRQDSFRLFGTNINPCRQFKWSIVLLVASVCNRGVL